MTSRSFASGLLQAAVLSLAAASFSAAQAATFVVDFENIYSYAERGDDGNATLSFDLGPNSFITGFSWDVSITAFDPSWLSEITVAVTNSAGAGFSLRPVDSVNASGTQSASGSADLLNSGLSFYTRADGRINFEFYEFYSDFAAAADGRWNSGQFSIIYTPIPEPATLALLGAGLLTVVSRTRRREATASAER